jgi:hypothetical protein
MVAQDVGVVLQVSSLHDLGVEATVRIQLVPER